MKKNLYFFLCFFFINGVLTSLEWPLNNFSFSMLFGDVYSKQGAFQTGLILRGDESVKVSEYGKKLIVIEENKNLRSFPSTLGNAIVVSHKKGLQTIYAGLKNLPTITDANSSVETFSIIGTLGDSAWGGEHELTFQVIDTQEKSFINPTRHLLSLLPFNDVTPPLISGTVLVSEKTKETYKLDNIKSLKQGEYHLYTFTKDSIVDLSESFMPFEIVALINGKTALDVQLYVLESNKGQLYLKKTKTSAEKLYNNEGKIYLGKVSLKRGHSEISISATDISQNTTRVVYTLQVE